MPIIKIQGAQENNLKRISVEIQPGLTAVTGVSGSGKSSLVFDTLYHEARRRILDLLSLGMRDRLAPARVESIRGLGPTVAIGQDLLNRNPNSTLASASGLHPFLRLLFASYGQRQCPQCDHPATFSTVDEILQYFLALTRNQPLDLYAPLVQGVAGSHRTLLECLRDAFGLESLHIDGKSWQGRKRISSLHPEKPHEILLHIAQWEPRTKIHAARGDLERIMALGATSILAIQAGTRHQLSHTPSCMRCGYWFEPLAPTSFHQMCPYCDGAGCGRCGATGLPPQASATRWEGMRFPELLERTVSELHQVFESRESHPLSKRLRHEISSRLQALKQVGLGYLTLNRPSPTLSRGEAQRVRLAVTLTSTLTDIVHILDEPTIGQHPQDFQNLLTLLREIPGPVIYVEHDRMATAIADQVLDLGPEAGPHGGEIVFQGPPSQLWEADTHTGRYFSLRERIEISTSRPLPEDFLTIQKASLRNLRRVNLAIPLARMTVIAGVSGSGKSTFVEDVLIASLRAREPVGCEALSGTLLQPILVDQSPIGRNPRSNPATYTKLSDQIRDLFASLSGFSISHFSFNRPEGACPTCKGMGAIEVKLRYLPSTWIRCETCAGKRFKDEILEIRISLDGRALSIAEFYELTVAECLDLIGSTPTLPDRSRSASLRHLLALQDVGLGYMQLGQPSTTLSGGEAQRVKLAKFLVGKAVSSKLIVLDEPSTGLHPYDIAALLRSFSRLVEEGATLVVVEHNLDILRAADWIHELGPGAGDEGGQLIFSGTVEDLRTIQDTPTGKALREDAGIRPPPSTAKVESSKPEAIHIKGARANNLQDLELKIPKVALTVLTGVSGSGKSSLLLDVLGAEAHRRYLETLTMYERQSTSEGPEAAVESISGLGVTLSPSPRRSRFQFRATVGVETDLSHLLSAMMAVAGERACLECGARMERHQKTDSREIWECPVCQARSPIAEPRHFSPSTYSSACTRCQGIGSISIPNPDKLIIHPEKPLCDGAMYSPGFFPKGYLCKPGNHGYNMVQAISHRYQFDPFTTPWDQMTDQAQQTFLYGDPDPIEVEFQSRTRRSVKTIRFPGFYGFIRDWDVGGTYTDTQDCSECKGTRFRPEILAVRLAGMDMHQLSELTLSELHQTLKRWQNRDLPRMEARAGQIQPTLRAALQRLRFLSDVGLGYLHLNRLVYSLSAGEAQRIKLAGLLGSDLASLTLLIDEPSRGLHPVELAALLRVLQELKQAGNTIVVVEHDPQVIQAADHLVDLGPGAGDHGGRIIDQGRYDQVKEGKGITARWLRGERCFELPLNRREPSEWIQVYGARANNLKIPEARIPLGTLTGVCGVSGSGKSSLIIDTLGRALAPIKHTTSVAHEPIQPGAHDRITGAPPRTLTVDQSRSGITNPGAFLGLDRHLRKVFLSSPDALALHLSENDFTRKCSVCRGAGQIRTDMGFLPPVYSTCETCAGTGYQAELWDIKVRGVSLPELDMRTLEELQSRFEGFPSLGQSLKVALKMGLGYLVLRQPGRSLSGGEAQRLKLARELAKRTRAHTLYLLDEPTVGQHLEDVSRLAHVLHQMVSEGHSVLIVEHHPHLLASCDWLIEMGPGGGPEGGQIIASGTPEQIARLRTPTASYLMECLGVP